MKLHKDWKRAWRWYSVQAIAALGGLPLAYMALPKDWQEAVPDGWKVAAVVVVMVAGYLGRIVDQTKGEP